MDHDTVEMSNLQRQVLHTEARVGVPKALSAAEAIKQYVLCYSSAPTLSSKLACAMVD